MPVVTTAERFAMGTGVAHLGGAGRTDPDMATCSSGSVRTDRPRVRQGGGMATAVASPPRSFTYVDSPLGPLLLVGDERALTGLYLGAHEKCPRPDAAWVEDAAPFATVARQLDEYFAGTREEFDVDVELVGTPFQVEVWQALRGIPYGETIS